MSTEQSLIGKRKLNSGLAAVLVMVWTGGGVLCANMMTWVEMMDVAGILLASVSAILIFRGTTRMAAHPAGRLITTGIFFCGALVLSPVFHRNIAERSLREADALTQSVLVLSAISIVLLWFLSRGLGSWQTHPQWHSETVAGQLEIFILSAHVRWHLALFGAMLCTIGLALGGLPIQAALPQSIVLAAMLLALPTLLRMAASPSGSRAVNGAAATALAACLAIGASKYIQLWSWVSHGNVLLEAKAPEEARKSHDQAMAINKVLHATAPELSVETSWAKYYEQIGDLTNATSRWNQVADMQHIDRAAFLPAQRILFKMGDSLNAWRLLIYHGFPAINDPELAPGIKALGERPGSDVRAKLLMALLSWDQKDSFEERKRCLEQVQEIAPYEPTSYTLLRRMKIPLPEAELILPSELLVCSKATLQSVVGTIEELGELDTLMVMDRGHYELGLMARATPWREEWPIVSVQIDGYEIGRAQIDHPNEQEFTFTFDVNQPNIFHIKIIFENHLEDLDRGRIARRGLVIRELLLRRAGFKSRVKVPEPIQHEQFDP